jgi:ketol-acid reductoisomerase
MTGPFIKGMYQQAISAKEYAEQRLSEKDFMKRASEAEIKRLEQMIRSGKVAEKMLKEMKEEEELMAK